MPTVHVPVFVGEALPHCNPLDIIKIDKKLLLFHFEGYV